jgi:hypothetical protein
MMPSPDPDEPSIDHEAAVEHVREAWLRLRVFDHVDAGLGGGYAFDPSDYAPVPVAQDGERAVVFART